MRQSVRDSLDRIIALKRDIEQQHENAKTTEFFSFALEDRLNMLVLVLLLSY